MRTILSKGERIKIGTDIFQIVELIGCGSSCIAYKAKNENELDNSFYVLKEFYPKNINLKREKSQELIPINDESKLLFDNGEKEYVASVKQQIFIRNNIEETINFTIGARIAYANNTCYIIEPLYNGCTYDVVIEDNIIDTMKHIKAICKIMKVYHDNGYLHLDIKPSNIFVIPETSEFVLLVDLDSLVPIDKIQEYPVRSSNNWAASELVRNNKKNISKRTDIFSIAEVLFYKLFNRHSLDSERRPFSTYDFTEVEMVHHCNPKVSDKLGELFRHTLCFNPERRYYDLSFLLDVIDDIIATAMNENYLISDNCIVRDDFVGREKDISDINRIISKEKILYITGMGGIGKTELVRNYLAITKKFNTVIFCRYESGWLNLISHGMSRHIANFIYSEEDEEITYNRVMNILRKECNENVLIVFDNVPDRAFVNSEAIRYREILELSAKFIVTTRNNISNYPELKVLPLKEKEQIEIFEKNWNCLISREEYDNIHKLIELVLGNTLAIELLAKMSKRVGLERIIQQLEEKGFVGTGRIVSIDKDQVVTRKTAYEHIKALFTISDLTVEQQRIILFLALCPIEGISFTRLVNMLNYNDTEIDILLEQGWVNENDDHISVHPLISEVAINEIGNVICLEKQFSELEEIIKKNCDRIQGKDENNLLLWSIFNKYKNIGCNSKNFLSLLMLDNETTPLDSNKLPVIYKYCIDVMENTVEINTESLVRGYLNYAESQYQVVGDLESAMFYLDKAYNLANNCELEDKEWYLACIALTKAEIYYEFHNIDDGYKSCETALGYVDLYSGDDYKKNKLYANLYDVLGGLETITCADYKKALDYHLKSYQYFSRCEGEIGAGLKIELSNIGWNYLYLGEFSKAEEYIVKSIEMGDMIYGKNSIEQLTTWSNYAVLLRKIGRYAEAKDIHERALKSSYEYYGYDNKNTANQYAYLAMDLCLLKDYENCEIMLNNAISIYDRLFDIHYSNKIRAIWTIADIYFSYSEYNKAMKHYKALLPLIRDICESDGNHKSLGNIYNDIAKTYKKTCDLNCANVFFEKALKEYKETDAKEEIEQVTNSMLEL